MSNKKRKAFTLTELLIVVVIIGVLSAVVLPKFTKIIEARRTTEAEELMAAVRNEQEARCSISKNYTADLSKLASLNKQSDTKNYKYEDLEGVGVQASAKGSYTYNLRMPSYVDGRICCEGQDCEKLNKDYPTCDELQAKGDYVPGNTECEAEPPCNGDHQEGEEASNTACECGGPRIEQWTCQGTEWVKKVVNDCRPAEECAPCKDDTTHYEGEEVETKGDGTSTCGTKLEKYTCQNNQWTLVPVSSNLLPKPEDEGQTLECEENGVQGTKTIHYTCDGSDWKMDEVPCKVEECTSEESESCETVINGILGYENLDRFCQMQNYDKVKDNSNSPSVSKCSLDKWFNTNDEDEEIVKKIGPKVAYMCCRMNKFKLSEYGKGSYVVKPDGVNTGSGDGIVIALDNKTLNTQSKYGSRVVADVLCSGYDFVKQIPECPLNPCRDCDENSSTCDVKCYKMSDYQDVRRNLLGQYQNVQETFHSTSADGVVGVFYSDAHEQLLWHLGNSQGDIPSCDYSIDSDKTQSQILLYIQAGFSEHGDTITAGNKDCSSYCRRASTACQKTEGMQSSSFAQVSGVAGGGAGIASGSYCMKPKIFPIDVYSCETEDFTEGQGKVWADYVDLCNAGFDYCW